MNRALMILWLSVVGVMAAPPPVQFSPWTTNKNNGATITASNVVSLVGPVGPYGESYDANTGWIKVTNSIQGVLNVHVFGAKGDGFTDDTSAFQSAFDLCSRAVGNQLLIPVPLNFYKITKTLVVNGGFRITGRNSAIKGIGILTNLIVLSNFNGGTIENLKFKTDQTNPTNLETAVFSQSENVNNVTLRNLVVDGMRTILRNATTTNSTCTNLWIESCNFTGDFSKQAATGGDLGNVVEVRGFKGFHVVNNNWTTQNEEAMLKLSNSGEDGFVQGNLFMDTATASIGSPCIDTFANSKGLVFSGNHFVLNGYSDAISCKPTTSGIGAAFSEPDKLEIVDNIFEVTHSLAVGSVLSLFGSWGLSDQSLSNSIVTVQNNQFKIHAPSDTYPQIVARGFTHASITGNSVARYDRIANMAVLDASNDRDIVISGNNLEGGAVIVADNQSNYPGTTYTNCPISLTFTGNSVRGVPSFGCLWLTGLTNQSGLRSLVVSGNTLYPTNGTGGSAAIIRIDNSKIQDAVVCDNAGASDFATYYKVNGTVISGNEVYLNNTWQQNAAFPYVTIYSLTNATIDFQGGPVQYISGTTNNMYFTATNVTAGARTTIRMHSPVQALSLSYDPAFAVVGPIPTSIPQFGTLQLDFLASAAGNTNANVIVTPHIYPDPMTINSGFIRFDREIASDGIIAAGTQFYANGQSGITYTEALVDPSGIVRTNTYVGGIRTGTTSTSTATNLAAAQYSAPSVIVNSGGNGLELDGQTASTVLHLDGTHHAVSVPNGTGVLSNDGSGGLSWVPGVAITMTNVFSGVITQRVMYSSSGQLTNVTAISY